MRFVNITWKAISNGRYKGNVHRVVVNNRETRMSVVVLNGPELDKEIGPARQFLEKEEALFKTITYRDYFRVQQQTSLFRKTALDHIRIIP